jgi:hypothetical protein
MGLGMWYVIIHVNVNFVMDSSVIIHVNVNFVMDYSVIIHVNVNFVMDYSVIIHVYCGFNLICSSWQKDLQSLHLHD